MNVTIIGGGNIGTQFAVHARCAGHETTIFTTKPQLFSNKLEIVNEDGVFLRTDGIMATDSARIACTNADLIFITLPAFLMKKIANEIEPFVQPNAKIGLIPGTGGGECAFKRCIEKGCTLFGFQRVPSVARVVTYGQSVKATGYRDTLHVSAIPNSKAKQCANLVESIFKIPCETLPNYLNITLTPSNPILHTTRLFSIFNDYFVGKTYDQIPLFYEQWSDKASEILFLCDDEVQKICNTLPIDLSCVKSLKEHYESDTPEKLTKKLSSIQSLKSIKTPSVEINGKFIPDLNSRYFTADFPYGLEIIVQIADMANVNADNCKKVLSWYYTLSGNTDRFNYKDYGITSVRELVTFYNN